MGQITADQSQQVIATLALNTDWASIDFAGSGLQDSVIRNPKEAGRQFTEFLKNGARVFSEPLRSWHEENGLIRFSVTSDGTTGPNWINRLEKKRVQSAYWHKDILNSSDFKPTNGITYEIGVLKGELFSESDRVFDKISEEAVRRKMIHPEAEIACLIREKFTNEQIEEMGIKLIVTMHKPIKDPIGRLTLLGTNRCDYASSLSAYNYDPSTTWSRSSGFAFIVSQV